MKRIVLVLILFLAILSACSKKESPQDIFEKIRQQNIANAKSDFERQCYIDNNSWMSMRSMKNALFTSETSCLGCMPDSKMHICDFEEYKQFIGAN